MPDDLITFREACLLINRDVETLRHWATTRFLMFPAGKYINGRCYISRIAVEHWKLTQAAKLKKRFIGKFKVVGLTSPKS